MIAGAKCGEKNGLGGAKTRLPAPLNGGGQPGSGRSISVARNIRIKFLRRDVERLGDSQNQVLIRLMRQKRVHGRGLDPSTIQQFANYRGKFAGSLHDDRAAIHMQRLIELETKILSESSIRMQ